MIFDGHNDTLLRLFDTEGKAHAFFERGAGQLDLARAREGGLAGGIFAIFTPAPPGSDQHDPFAHVQVTPQGYLVPTIHAIDPAYAERHTNQVIALLNDLIRQSQGQVGLVRAYSDLAAFLTNHILAVVLHLEGAEAIQPNLSNLPEYYAKGVRSIGLVWSRPNAFGQGMDFRFPGTPDTGEGLTTAGKALIRKCRQMGILVDLAHLNYKGFWDAARLEDAPLVVSHTGVHALCPAGRNLMDDQIDAVGKSGGLVGIMFEPSELRPDGLPDANMPLDEIARHIQYVAERIGEDYVALGSDFDGALMPADLPDASNMPKLVHTLEQRGVTGETLEKILFRNWMRVLKSAFLE